MSKPMIVNKGYLYFDNRRFLVVEPEGLGGWRWRYSNGNGNTISEGFVDASMMISALLAAADEAGVTKYLS